MSDNIHKHQVFAGKWHKKSDTGLVIDCEQLLPLLLLLLQCHDKSNNDSNTMFDSSEDLLCCLNCFKRI